MRGEGASDLGKSLGRRLAILRELRDLTQSQLARKTRISRSSLSLYEAGKKVPDLATLLRILDALDCGLGALDRADEFCVAVRLTPQCRPPLEIQVASLAAEAGSVLGRLMDAVALLALPMSERVRSAASAEGHPLPEDREKAAELWERIRKYPHEGRSALFAELPEFRTWALSELLAHESAEAASDSAAAALELAQEALEVAERIPGDRARRSRSRGYALGHLGNAQRVQGDLDARQAGSPLVQSRRSPRRGRSARAGKPSAPSGSESSAASARRVAGGRPAPRCRRLAGSVRAPPARGSTCSPPGMTSSRASAPRQRAGAPAPHWG